MSETVFEHGAAAKWLLDSLVTTPPNIRLQFCRERYQFGSPLHVALILPNDRHQVKLWDPIRFASSSWIHLDMMDLEPDPQHPRKVDRAILASMDKALPTLTPAQIIFPTHVELVKQLCSSGAKGPSPETMGKIKIALSIDCQQLSTTSESFPLRYLFPAAILQQCYDLYKPQKEPWTPGYKLI